VNTVLSLGIILLAGVLAAKFLRRAKFPMVTTYLLLGIIIGPYLFNLVPEQILGASGLFSNIVLGIIAFTLGQNFSSSNFRKLGKSVFFISIGEVTVSWAVVTFVFHFILKQPLYLSLLFGAIAPATAPAAIVMVVRECRARGPLASTILGVVAIDDAWGLILFAVSLAISKSIFLRTVSSFPFLIILKALLEVGGAFLLGGSMGWLLSCFSRFARNRDELLIFTSGLILSTIGLAIYFNFSVLLACMVLGTAVININPVGSKFFDIVKTIDSPIYLIFFALTGASLELFSLRNLGIIAGVYLIMRPLGEWIGAYLGAVVSGSVRLVRNYIGFALVPQAGVALGMALLCKSVFPEAGIVVLNVIIATTVIFEIVGPFFARFALSKANEIEK
jgi:NhaP-type Na+/H+ or K+/H+ antiporter